MAHATASTTAGDDQGGLIFQWERRARSRWRLALMLAASLLAHAGSFYIFQVAYTPTGTQLPPPAQVVLVPLDRPENAPLARWLATNDPALTTRPAAPPAAQTLAAVGFRYVPSYDAAQPPFKALDRAGAALDTVPPRGSLPGPVPVPPPALTPAAHPGGSAQATRLVLTGAIAPDTGAALPPVRFRVSEASNVLDPTIFLVGVRAGGGPPFVFRQSVSGSAALDEYARGYLAGAALEAKAPVVGDGPAWGMATFYWGSDVYGP